MNATMGPVVFALLLAGCVAGRPDFHSELSTDDLQEYFGVQDREQVPSYEVVSPVLTSPHPPSPLTSDRPHRPPPMLAPKKAALSYSFAAFGDDFHLLLHHNDDLIAPGCLVHYLQSNGTKKVRPCPSRHDDCYYHGASLNHHGSQAALSTCDGLHGLIQLPDRDHDLWIQPVEQRHVQRAKRSTRHTMSGHPHIYKRAVTDRRYATGVPEASSLVSQAAAASRVRRASGDKFAEMLLVADTTMHHHYEDSLRQYILTVANVAARVLLDPSIGTPVHFTVVKIQILEADQPDLTIDQNASATLSSFCSWQEQFNPADDSNPQHYDGAALFTRTDIVYHGVPETVGLSPPSGMCQPRKRCSINEDDGLGVGLTLAHETGHTLGMPHDSEGNHCENGKNMMATQGGGGLTAMFWSNCSRQHLASFLASEDSSCLDDQPQTSVDLPKDLPGVVYDGNQQCELFLGPGSTLCLGTSIVHGDECTFLACFGPRSMGSCKTDYEPRMDGTTCGDRKYCMHGQCVDIGPNGPQPRDGGWSAWDSDWSACSRTCGGGVRVRRRKCDNPRPRLGGRKCVGWPVMAEMCNVQECRGISQQDYRGQQCARSDSQPYKGQRHHWVPVNMLDEQQCKLLCRIDGQTTPQLRQVAGSSWYENGTICVPVNAPYGRCIDGRCQEFGCDGKTGSSYQYDRCMVCGGQGDTCSRQSGTYTQGRKEEYVTFLTIPYSSTAVTINNANRYTQMSVVIGGKRLFNEDGRSSDPSGLYTANGIEVIYRAARSGLEKIKIKGPLSEPVQAQVYCQYDSRYVGAAPQIDYEYFVPTSNPRATPYMWNARNGACTHTCGGGVYNQVITCTRRSNHSQVDDHFCNLWEKPYLNGSASCNTQACPPRWRPGQYGQCSTSCSSGQQTRTVECVEERAGVEVVVDGSRCPGNNRPATERSCNVHLACPEAVWVTGSWSPCSMTCGKGVHTRSVKCMNSSGQEVAHSQCPEGMPRATQNCVSAICNADITGDACNDANSTRVCAMHNFTMCSKSGFAQDCMKYCDFCSPDGSVETTSTAQTTTTSTSTTPSITTTTTTVHDNIDYFNHTADHYYHHHDHHDPSSSRNNGSVLRLSRLERQLRGLWKSFLHSDRLRRLGQNQLRPVLQPV